MLFSFLVPVYNVEKYLKKCLDSLLIQKGAPFEIVLLDDGSTDTSGLICDCYADQYPEVVRVIHKQNEGLLLTRRRGFKEARGDWFICVDSDDYVSPQLLETVVSLIRKYDCDMVMYNYNYADDQGRITPSRLKLADGTVYNQSNKSALYNRRLLTTSINNMWMRALRRDIVDINADYSMCGLKNMCEDAVQVLALYTKAQKIIYSDQKLYYYRKNESSITGSVNVTTWKSINCSFRLTQPYLEKWNVSEEVKNRFYTQQMENICNCVRWAFSRQNKDLICNKEYITALKSDSLFSLCRKNFKKNYTSTRYCKLSVPILMKMIEKENLSLLRVFFASEAKIIH